MCYLVLHCVFSSTAILTIGKHRASISSMHGATISMLKKHATSSSNTASKYIFSVMIICIIRLTILKELCYSVV